MTQNSYMSRSNLQPCLFNWFGHMYFSHTKRPAQVGHSTWYRRPYNLSNWNEIKNVDKKLIVTWVYHPQNIWSNGNNALALSKKYLIHEIVKINTFTIQRCTIMFLSSSKNYQMTFIFAKCSVVCSYELCMVVKISVFYMCLYCRLVLNLRLLATAVSLVQVHKLLVKYSINLRVYLRRF